MYKKILAPVDGSELSECSLAHVKAIASGCKVPEVVLLRVIEPFQQVGMTSSYINEDLLLKMRKEAELRVEDNLSKLANNLNSEGIIARTAIAQGMVANEILDYASKNNVDLIIMSTHGSSGIVRWALGSVADKVLRHSQVPVLIVAPKSCRIS
jgi:nucleotide-binding universal stress UspA family protein